MITKRAMRLMKRMSPRHDTSIKLNVGCGTDYKAGWINIDNNSDNNISRLDLNWDLRNPLPFKEDSVDFVFNEHFIEHLTVEEGQGVIRDFMRVLKPGGVLRMATPDLEVTINKYLSVPLEEDPTVRTFGLDFIKTRAERLNIAFRWWGHQWLYDWEEMTRRLREAGCENFVRCKIYASEHAELRGLETRAESLLIVEVTK